MRQPRSDDNTTDERGPTRRRGAALEAAILAAALDELSEMGYLAFTFERVAERAQTSRTVLYRRWETKSELVAAAILTSLPASSDLPDRGSLRDDVIEALQWARERFHRIGRDVILGLMAETRPGGELAAMVQGELVGTMRLEIMGPILERARERGEVGLQPIPSRVVAVPLDLVRHELLTSEQVTDASITSIVDEIFLPLVLTPISK